MNWTGGQIITLGFLVRPRGRGFLGSGVWVGVGATRGGSPGCVCEVFSVPPGAQAIVVVPLLWHGWSTGLSALVSRNEMTSASLGVQSWLL